MKKERVHTVGSSDDLEIMSEIIKNDPWLLEQVLDKIRAARPASVNKAIQAKEIKASEKDKGKKRN